MSPDDLAIRQGCTRFLSGHLPVAPSAMLGRLAAAPAAREAADFYGAGGAVAALEARAAALLDKEAALFFINGVTAQLAVLRAHCERRGLANVAIHPLSHLDVDEAGAIEQAGAARAIRLGRVRPFGLAELKAVADPLAAVVIELPLRRAGYLLPPIEELRAVSAWCRDHSIPLHFDGARLWEAAAGYGMSVAALAALADSVYVSFYKGLGGLAGAVVAGSGELIGSALPWKTRYGGNLHTAYPYAIAALEGLDNLLPRMGAFTDKARALATLLAERPGLIVNPRRPEVNAFQLVLEGAPAGWAARNREFARARGIWLFNTIGEAPLAGHAIAEVVIGNAADHYAIEEAGAWIADFLSLPTQGAAA